MDYYHLNEDGTVTPFTHSFLSNLEAWLQESKEEWEKDRHIGLDVIEGFRVSTVFLVLDHGWNGEPVLFETMIFGPEDHRLNDYQERYHTHAEAVEGHQTAVDMVKLTLKQEKELADIRQQQERN